jgi:hypothetical protein
MKWKALAKIHEPDTALQRYWTPDRVIDFRQIRGLWPAVSAVWRQFNGAVSAPCDASLSIIQSFT